MSRARLPLLRWHEPLRVGFLPVSDCAPLVYAREADLFEKYDLEVELERENSWASLRDKVIDGELDAAHAPATLPFLANLGLDSDPCACVSGLVLSLQGSAITISRQLWEQGVRDAATLREQIYRTWGKRSYTFGVSFSFSTQELLLRHWFKSAGIIPEVEIRIVAIPPEQMFPTLKLGYIDGYCVSEPWTSVAVQAGVGVCVATSAQLAPRHPEKVLMVRQSFATGRADEHERLVAALLEACAFCDAPENRWQLSDLLAQPHYVNAPAECIQAGLAGQFSCSVPGNASPVDDLVVFHRDNANEPCDGKARWLMNELYELLKNTIFKYQKQERTPVLKNIFRRDIFARGQALLLEATGKTDTEGCGEAVPAGSGA
ncbi:MAG TPA: CmpA/NrtA family ABC transporter substrate-binding protein [Candidatus Binatia bacterium]|jgi:ABC-type nitrate/sulfonate/bicarbonate transport system substrate-binding protein|nr:CmpA/NrtA family ABC transporter substrate-binding protein [Candidatus Binatia bacterium]